MISQHFIYYKTCVSLNDPWLCLMLLGGLCDLSVIICFIKNSQSLQLKITKYCSKSLILLFIIYLHLHRRAQKNISETCNFGKISQRKVKIGNVLIRLVSKLWYKIWKKGFEIFQEEISYSFVPSCGHIFIYNMHYMYLRFSFFYKISMSLYECNFMKQWMY